MSTHNICFHGETGKHQDSTVWLEKTAALFGTMIHGIQKSGLLFVPLAHSGLFVCLFV